MIKQKKFGTFSGVFTPSLLTILGVIMYLRMGWVVGSAGLDMTLVIIGIAHIISVSTGLSISSIATDKKVGAGGVYYVLSRSLGLPIGGALGLTLFVATAFSIALYMVGFAEIFNSVFELGYSNDPVTGELIKNSDFSNSIRITGSLGLLALTILALISTSIALKTQFFILGLIVLSLFSIFLGSAEGVSIVKDYVGSDENVAGFFEVFAIFFPAVTGFTAGVAMSGDLKNSKKSIPYGTMLSILVGLLVYTVLAIFLSYSYDQVTLRENGKVMFESAYISEHFINFGVWGATLSSALGGILGGPRILQAMSVDKITPKLFAKGVGQGNEPRNALILTVIIAECGILIGDLNLIAEIVSMFYLAAYGFINLSFFLESWASADFNPSFKVKKWVGLIGFVATFVIMFKLNMAAMVAAFIIIGFVYFYLNKKQITLGTGDIWQSVWSTVVKKGLRKMEASNDHKRNWKPNLLMFSGGDSERGKFIEFSKAISGQTGIITNFDLIENTEAKVLFPKHKQIVKDEELEKYGVFGRQIEVQNEFKGIESIASTFGFSGIEPNTTLIPWPGETKDPIWFTEMTQKLIDLDYNVLYLDYDKRWGFRKKEQIDLWWRGVSNNAELMLSLVKFISTSSDWAKANIRILLVNNTNTENQTIEKRIQQVVDQFRLKSEIKIISNKMDKIPIYELMKMHSSDADLVFVGIPEIADINTFVQKTNELVNTIGTTLLVKASSHFDETDLKVETIELKTDTIQVEQTELNVLKTFEDQALNSIIFEIDKQWDDIFAEHLQEATTNIEFYHHKQIAKNQKILTDFLDNLKENPDQNIWKSLDETLASTQKIYADDVAFKLPDTYEHFNQAIDAYILHKSQSVYDAPSNISISSCLNNKGQRISKTGKIRFRKHLERLWENEARQKLHQVFLEFGYQNYILLHQSKNTLHHAIRVFVEQLSSQNNLDQCIINCRNELQTTLEELDESSKHLTSEFYKNLRNTDKALLEKLGHILEKANYRNEVQEKLPYLNRQEEKTTAHGLTNFSGYWNRNLVLFSLQLQSDIYLIQYTSKIEKILCDTIDNASKNYMSIIEENIEIAHENNSKLLSLIKDKNTEAIHQYSPQLLKDIYFNLEGTVQYVLENIQDALDDVPEEVELMNAHSVNNIRITQDKSVQTIKIQLDDITDYLTKIHFFKPFQDQITNYIIQLKKGVALLLNSTYKVQLELENFAKSAQIGNLEKAIEASGNDLTESKEYIKSIHKSYLIEVALIKTNLNQELDVNRIIEQYETLYPQAKLESKSKKLRGQLNQYKSKFGQKINDLISKVIQRKQDVSALDYNDKYKTILSQVNIFQNFFSKININSKITETLPFYYHQLFTGKHFADNQSVNNRKFEIEEAKRAINRIDSGISGGILILGEAMAGKSFLASHIAHHLLNGSKIYRLKLHRNHKKDNQFLTKAFQNATGIQDSITGILNKIDPKSTFIIDDLEKWWLNSNQQHNLVNEISQVMHIHGSTHYFVLSANLFAYHAIKKLSDVSKNIVGSILLNPLSSYEIREVIESRHHLGGLTYIYKTVPENFLSKSKKSALMHKFYTLSKGNIGLALRLWISAIEDIDENKITVNPIPRLDFPIQSNEMWLSLMYQFQIHKQLYIKELYTIYGPNNSHWISNNLLEMVKAGVLKNSEKDFYELPSDVRYFIEKELYD